MIKKVEILEKWKRGWTVPSPVLLLLLLLLHHPSPFFFSSGGKDSKDSATLWVTLASRIVYRVMSLHTGASAPLSFSLSPDPSPSVPFHSILPRSRHCSAVPFIRNKVSSDPAQCTPVFLGSLYLFLSSSALSLSPPTLPCPPLSRNLCAIVAPPAACKIALNVADRFSFIKRQDLKRMLLLVCNMLGKPNIRPAVTFPVYYFAIDEPFFFFRFLDRFRIINPFAISNARCLDFIMSTPYYVLSSVRCCKREIFAKRRIQMHGRK